ncbi:MAG TPA: hypothetical protein VFS40_09295 [Gemmatimonadales bacterium]|nr:hypothetical protein [Gemmatimonadales bacterium]
MPASRTSDGTGARRRALAAALLCLSACGGGDATTGTGRVPLPTSVVVGTWSLAATAPVECVPAPAVTALTLVLTRSDEDVLDNGDLALDGTWQVGDRTGPLRGGLDQVRGAVGVVLLDADLRRSASLAGKLDSALALRAVLKEAPAPDSLALFGLGACALQVGGTRTAGAAAP